MTGAQAVFADCSEETYNIDLANLESKISRKTKALAPVHLYGQKQPLLNSNKERLLNVIGSKARAVFDDLNGLEPIRIYEKGIGFDDRYEKDYGEYKLLLRDGDIISPNIEVQEPLKIIVDHFVRSLLYGEKFVADGRFALNISRSIASAQRSMERDGIPEMIEYGC